MHTANVTVILATTIQPDSISVVNTLQTSKNSIESSLSQDPSSLITDTPMSSSLLGTDTLNSTILSSQLTSQTIISNSTSSGNIISTILTSPSTSLTNSSSLGHNHIQVVSSSTSLIYSSIISSPIFSTTSLDSSTPSLSLASSYSSEIRQSSKVSVILITTTVSPSFSALTSITSGSLTPSVITQTLTVTPSVSPLFSISSGSSKDYLIYTQEYLFTDSDTSFTTGLLQTTALKKSASGIILPTNVVTKPVSYYKAYVDGSLDSGSSTTATHKNVIIGSVVGSVIGVGVIILLGVLYYLFVRKRHKKESAFATDGKRSIYMDDSMTTHNNNNNNNNNYNEKNGDPFKNEFQFNERVPGQIPVPEDPLDYSVSMRDSSDFQFNPDSSIDMSIHTDIHPYEESNVYSYTRSITDWRNDSNI
ncbi:similar to Kazachstania africana KAFR_0F00420 hypothetical protein [Maudiozyma saulgeensis]|uniref:Mid2 domain-containing protein n=1 Tax=Maudiozyma saulgeensis TaxID=1789683 RepID=A0A1X7R7A3_9SACH|nr:similar to Kazachstania africana KAFR_0F00420 hypothetical protein [Kazachstania saulgeensis]